MWEFIVGGAVGAGAMVVKDYVANSENKEKNAELETLMQENETLRKRLKESERIIEDLEASNTHLHRQLQEKDDDKDDACDALQDALKKIKELERQVRQLLEQIEDYRESYETVKTELEALKR